MAAVERYDAVVVGGGINGASIFHALATAGHRVLLVDRGDFASGTSQASAMLVWGGLLYLRDAEILAVGRLSSSRDALIRAGAGVERQPVRYVVQRGGRSRLLVQSFLYAYWALGGLRRPRPRFHVPVEGASVFDPARVRGTLAYEEGRVRHSDARFVLSWILGAASETAVARNYCALEGGGFDLRSGLWRLALRDPSGSHDVEARLVVNAAGAWTDVVNGTFRRRSPWRHLLSRGVSLCVPRNPAHIDVLACDAEAGGTAMSLVPWGPVALWGSTDTIHADVGEAAHVTPGDVDYLLQSLNRQLADPIGRDDVVSLRCGVRPLAVPSNCAPSGDLRRLSRQHRIHADPDVPWISVYGGKLSGCGDLAAAVRRQAEMRLGPAAQPAVTPIPTGESDHAGFPGLPEPVVSPAWCVRHEHCRCLDDYLRRRTNIAQWVPRGGLGRRLEFLDHVRGIARVIHGGNAVAAESDVAGYRERIDRQWRLVDPGAAVHQKGA
jgi:glycerol-3-phosphate dehydrogenase